MVIHGPVGDFDVAGFEVTHGPVGDFDEAGFEVTRGPNGSCLKSGELRAGI